jgi:hypothetical protein
MRFRPTLIRFRPSPRRFLGRAFHLHLDCFVSLCLHRIRNTKMTPCPSRPSSLVPHIYSRAQPRSEIPVHAREASSSSAALRARPRRANRAKPTDIISSFSSLLGHDASATIADGDSAVCVIQFNASGRLQRSAGRARPVLRPRRRHSPVVRCARARTHGNIRTRT